MIDEILKLKKEKGFVLLAHNYQLPEIQEAADFVGDSLQLALFASKVPERNILFLGVDFMAELIKALNPDKRVIVPDPGATCPMANTLTVEIVEKFKEEFPGVPFVLYVNSRIECKALADVICTSANAVEIVKKLPTDTVLFGPDKNLAEYVAERTGKKVIPVPGEEGFCPVHQFDPSSVDRIREAFPGVKVMVHPECPKAVRDKADFVGSTGQMEKYPTKEPSKVFAVGTESGMIHKLSKVYPEKVFVPLEEVVCENMKKNTLEKVLHALREEKTEIVLPKDLIEKAKKPILRMFELLG